MRTFYRYQARASHTNGRTCCNGRHRTIEAAGRCAERQSKALRRELKEHSGSLTRSIGYGWQMWMDTIEEGCTVGSTRCSWPDLT